MEYLKIYPTSINEKATAQAADSLRKGNIIIYPTDSLYAMGCNALDNRAIERLCSIKGINPAKQMLSVVCANMSQASEYARIDNRAFDIMRRNAPGPFTFILPAAPTLPKAFKGRRTVGIRIPDNAIACALAEAMGNPILSTGINADPDFDHVDPRSLELEYSSIVDLIIDGGDGGVTPSTIVDLTDSSDPQLVRQGCGTLQ